MTEVHPIVLILLLELLAITSIVSVIWLTSSLRRARNDKRAMQVLFRRVNQSAEQRLLETKQHFARFGYTDGKVEELAHHYDVGTKAFYRAFATIYRDRTATTLSTFDSEIDAMVGTMRPGEAPPVPDAPVLAPSGLVLTEDAEDARIAELERRNRALTDELEHTQAMLDQLMSEYSAMFAPTKTTAPVPSATVPPAFITEPEPEESSIDMATGEELFNRLRAQSK
ncbi:MAG: hypothetical protein AAF493_24725 [Pseudomonadota bacterium]